MKYRFKPSKKTYLWETKMNRKVYCEDCRFYEGLGACNHKNCVKRGEANSIDKGGYVIQYGDCYKINKNNNCTYYKDVFSGWFFIIGIACSLFVTFYLREFFK